MTLNEIMENGNPREIRRAVAVSFHHSGVERKIISEALHVSIPFIDKWVRAYSDYGADSLLLQYKGSEGYLSDDEKNKILTHIRKKKNITLEYLVEYLEVSYGVVYNSKQSYYNLLHDGGRSWKKSEKENPKKDMVLVEKKRDEIKKTLIERKDEIVSGRLVVWVEDETHLTWGDACGYVWGKKNKKTPVAMINMKERQTVYGAFNYFTHKVSVIKYDSGNSHNTIDYIEHLRMLSNYESIIIIWDGASYHRFAEMPNYLTKINEGLNENEWKVTCVLLVPHAPEENPMEDIWLKGKNWIRKNFHLNKTFEDVVDCFMNFLDRNVFNFDKMSIFGTI